MDRLIELLRTFDLDPEDPDYSQLTDEQLADLHSQLLALFDEIRDGETVDIEALTQIADVSDAVLAEDTARQEQAEADAQTIAELEARIRPAGESDSDSDDDGDSDGEDTVDEPEATDDGDGGEESSEEVDEPEAVAASAQAPAQPRRLSLTQLANARRGTNEPDSSTPDDGARLVITAGGDIPGVSAGQPLQDLDAVADALTRRISSLDGTRLAPGQKFQVARMRREYPEERRLSDSDGLANRRRVEAVVAAARQAFLDGEHQGSDLDSLAAAGGLCAPLTPRYEQDTVGNDTRPVAAALPNFEARGGVRFIPPPVLSDIASGGPGDDAAVGFWSQDDDEAAGSDSSVTKPIQRIDCDDETTVEVYATTKRLLVGTQLARTFPERVRAFIDLTNVAHARHAEGLLLNRIKALSVQTSLDEQVLGSRRDLLAVWIKAAWALRNRHRMDIREPLQLIIPDAVIAQFRTDGVRQLPGDQRDRLSIDEVVGEMRAIDVEPIISPDMPAHIAPAQSASSQLRDLPSPIEWALFPMGTFSLIDRGDFDLGFTSGTPIRDTTRLAQNDYELFAENWENVAKFGGPESIWGRTPVCPTGTSSGTTEVDCDEAS